MKQSEMLFNELRREFDFCVSIGVNPHESIVIAEILRKLSKLRGLESLKTLKGVN
jgi:hypothetical protein